MTLYVLDTDIVGFAFQRHPTVLQRLQRLPENDLVVTTIITFGEDLGGWLPACRRAPDGVARARAYARLQQGLDFYQQWVCLPFDGAAAAIFEQWRAQKLRIGTNDLAIAAITLAVSGTLVTRNTVDFQRIPGLVPPPPVDVVSRMCYLLAAVILRSTWR
jgi:tRNA(fMet)-specific endonuclease VapC